MLCCFSQNLIHPSLYWHIVIVGHNDIMTITTTVWPKFAKQCTKVFFHFSNGLTIKSMKYISLIGQVINWSSSGDEFKNSFSHLSFISLQVSCVINNFQQMQPSPPTSRPYHPDSVLGMPMVTLPCVESPLEKLSGPQVRGGSTQQVNDRGVKISTSCLFPNSVVLLCF